jgi:hypothetical protein
MDAQAYRYEHYDPAVPPWPLRPSWAMEPRRLTGPPGRI